MLQPFFNVLLWAIVLTVVFYPMHRRIRDRLGLPSLAAIASTLLVVLLIVLPVTFITIAVVNELAGAAATLQNGVQRLTDPNLPVIGWMLERRGTTSTSIVRRRASSSRSACRRGARCSRPARSSSSAAPWVPSRRWGWSSSRCSTCSATASSCATRFYALLPLERVQTHAITLRTREVIEATLYGVLVIAAIQGTLGTVIFWVLGLPSPLLWGVVMFFLSMIPIAGSFLVWFPAAIFLAFTGSWLKAIVLVAWGILVIGSIDNFLSPRLVGKRARLHELLIFFGVLGGLQVFGVLGLVLGPVVVAITLALIEMTRAASATVGAGVSPIVPGDPPRIRSGDAGPD